MSFNKATILLLFFLVNCSRVEKPPTAEIQGDPEVTRDTSEVLQWTLSITQTVQIGLLKAMHHDDEAAQLITKEEVLLKSMAENNPNSVFAPLAKCAYLNVMRKQDAQPVCQQTITLLNERNERHPHEFIYYEAEASAFEFSGDKKDAIRVLEIERTILDPSDEKGFTRVDTHIQRLQ